MTSPVMYAPPKPKAFPYEAFLSYFPQFAPPANKAEFIVACGNRALLYVGRFDSAWLWGPHREYAVCLMAAHILYLTNKTNAETKDGGEVAIGPVTSTGVGGVSISMMTPQSASDGPFEFWLNKTPYGQEFLALVRTRGPMMTYVGSKTAVLPLR